MTRLFSRINSTISDSESLSDNECVEQGVKEQETMMAEEECVRLPKAVLLNFGLHQIKEDTIVKPLPGNHYFRAGWTCGVTTDGSSWRSLPGKLTRLRRYKSEIVEADDDDEISLSCSPQTKRSPNRLKTIVQVIVLERKMRKALQQGGSDLTEMKRLVNTFENISSKFVRNKCRNLYYDLLLSIKALELKSHHKDLRNGLISSQPEEVHSALQNILEGRSNIDLAQYLYASQSLIDERTHLRVA